MRNGKRLRTMGQMERSSNAWTDVNVAIEDPAVQGTVKCKPCVKHFQWMEKSLLKVIIEMKLGNRLNHSSKKVVVSVSIRICVSGLVR